jgi:hypothetical protein
MDVKVLARTNVPVVLEYARTQQIKRRIPLLTVILRDSPLQSELHLLLPEALREENVFGDRESGLRKNLLVCSCGMQ